MVERLLPEARHGFGCKIGVCERTNPPKNPGRLVQRQYNEQDMDKLRRDNGAVLRSGQCIKKFLIEKRGDYTHAACQSGSKYG